jgi:hypothetical protein
MTDAAEDTAEDATELMDATALDEADAADEITEEAAEVAAAPPMSSN